MSIYTQFYSVHTVKNKIFSGDVKIDDVLAAGDFGIGTFNQINGEMVAIDGNVYRTKSDGSAEKIVDTSEKTPYSIMTHFKSEKEETISNMPLVDVISRLDQLRENSERDILAVKVSGDFTWVRSRAPDLTPPPYKDLGELIADQLSTTFNDISGDVVGFYTPEYLGALGVPGYHLHFIDSSRSHGGHMQDLFVKEGSISIQKMSELRIHNPGGEVQEAEYEALTS